MPPQITQAPPETAGLPLLKPLSSQIGATLDLDDDSAPYFS